MPRSMKSLHEPHAAARSPTAPWPVPGTMMCLAFGRCLATASPQDGGVTGSRSPDRTSAGTAEVTGS